ncbi:hypothetical protein ABTM90_19880, partial [Acinetobacter baumannii]
LGRNQNIASGLTSAAGDLAAKSMSDVTSRAVESNIMTLPRGHASHGVSPQSRIQILNGPIKFYWDAI